MQTITNKSFYEFFHEATDAIYVKNLRGEPVEVIVNPEPRELREFRGVRLFVSDKDVYAWNPEDIWHQNMYEKLRIKSIPLMTYDTDRSNGMIEYIQVTDTIKESYPKYYHSPKIPAFLLKNKHFIDICSISLREQLEDIANGEEPPEDDLRITYFDYAVVGYWHEKKS